MAHRPILPPGEEYWEERKDIFRRLRNLERCAQLGSSSIREGALRLLDGMSGERARLGQLDEGEYGMQVVDAGGMPRLRVDGRGMLFPFLPGVTLDPDAFKTVATSTWTFCWYWFTPMVSHQALELFVSWSVSSGTTGEARLTVPGGPSTDPLPLGGPAGSRHWSSFRWLHGLTLSSGPMFIEVEVRRTAGTGNVIVYEPVGSMRSPAGCTSDGLGS